MYKMENEMFSGRKEKNSLVFLGIFSTKMILTGFLMALVTALVQAQNSEEEIPFVVASQDGGRMFQKPVEPPLTILGSPDTRGRGDIEIQAETEEETRFQGYFYPKPSKPFNLPEFKTLDGSFAEETGEHHRTRRSPYRRPHFPSPPPFRPGFIPPHHIRPLPAPYPHGRPYRY